MKKLICISLVIVLSFTLVSCGGVKFPSEEQIAQDIQENVNYSSFGHYKDTGMNIYVSDQEFEGSTKDVDYIVCPVISFKFTEKPKTKNEQVYIIGIMTLDRVGEMKIKARYDIFDDGSCEFVSASIVK